MGPGMLEYYAKRAPNYDGKLDFPEWQRDRAKARPILESVSLGRHVYEVACGTGEYTQLASLAAKEIHASDANQRMLEIARGKAYSCPVDFQLRDAYASGSPTCNAGLAAFWLSHVEKQSMARFLDSFHSWLVPGSPVFMIDELDHSKRGIPASRFDEFGNRFETRTLESGENFEITKNFYSEADCAKLLERRGSNLEFRAFENLWVATYRTLEPRPHGV